MDGAGIVLESCAAATAAGDGRDLFSFQGDGEIWNLAGGKCLGLQHDDAADGTKVVSGNCDAAQHWEVMGNGQMKLKGAGNLCLSQAGLAPGIQDVAAKAAVSATSSSNSVTHGLFPFLRFVSVAYRQRNGHSVHRCSDGRRRQRRNFLGIAL